MTAPHTVVVVPCYNEAERLRINEFVEHARSTGTRFLFVDDGSTDATAAIVASRIDGETCQLLRLEANAGKAEAVRHGLTTALTQNAQIVGYLDADLATPLDELERLREELIHDADVQVALAARVALLGRSIERRRSRHYLGRVFAAAASTMLRLPVYDTQCGLKLFRPSAGLAEALATPFRSRWAFDVELIGRVLLATEPISPAQIVEYPLQRWRDVPGSTLGLGDQVATAVDLVRITLELRSLRREAMARQPG